MTTLDCDILHPTSQQEEEMCKKKRLVPNPNSEFVSLRCTSCLAITTAFSNSTVPVNCSECNAPLAFPTGGRIKLCDGVEERAKVNS